MESDVHHVKAFSPQHGLHALVLEVRKIGDGYSVSCRLPVSEELLFGEADDCFAALQIVRRKAEGRNWSICCKGARRNVWPSAMSRSMGGGVMAYIHEMGRHGRIDSTVKIFDEDMPESYATVADQEAYAHDWFESLR